MNELLVQITVVAIAANVVLLLLAVTVPRVRRRLAPGGTDGGASGSVLATAGGPSLEPGMTGPYMDIERVDASAAATEGPGPPEVDEGEEPVGGNEVMTADTAPAAPPEPAPSPFDAGAAALIDMETGLETELAFEEAVRYEDARYARYGRPATVVVAELDRFDDLSERFGPFVADRLIAPVAATFRAQARRSDRVARTGHIRFQVLLPETDEVLAINYVERVREACDLWLENAAVSVRLVIGWASAGPAGSVPEAIRIAERRMHAERSRGVGGRRAPGGHHGEGGSGPSAGPSATAISPRSSVSPTGFESPAATVQPQDVGPGEPVLAPAEPVSPSAVPPVPTWPGPQAAAPTPAPTPTAPTPTASTPAAPDPAGPDPAATGPAAAPSWPAPGPTVPGPAAGHPGSPSSISPPTFTGPGGQRVFNRRSTDSWPRPPLPPTNQV